MKPTFRIEILTQRDGFMRTWAVFETGLGAEAALHALALLWLAGDTARLVRESARR